MATREEGDGGEGPPVWVVAADHWPRASLRAELIERGYDAVGFPTIRDAAGALGRPGARAPALLVLDLQQQELAPPLLDLIFRAAVPLIGVAGATEASGPEIRRHRWAAFLRRPITLGAIADTVERLLGARSSGQAD